MLSLIEHRGPDQAGYYIDNQVAMGTMRLSIIDVKSGIQPLADERERYWLSYNGELYNYIELRNELIQSGHQFFTNSDTEVMLKSWIQWGAKSLERFNGAFAFALYDTLTDDFILARDRFGKRPLFYFDEKSGLVFASEMKCFLGFPGFEFEFDLDSMRSILAHWTPLPDQSSFKRIKQLPPGCYLLAKGGSHSIHDYYRLDFRAEKFKGSEADAGYAIREAITQAVNLRLRSDVPMGVYLSGGLDSSIITGIASELIEQKPLRTFSVEFIDKEFDESKDQQLVSKKFSTIHNKLEISHKDIVDNFSKAVYHGEMPLFRTAPVPMYLLSRHVKQTGIKAILSGEGADEVFLGYNIFKETLLRKQWPDLNNQERREKLAKLYPYLKSFNEENHTYYMGLYNQYSKESLPGLFSHELRFQNGRFASKIIAQSSEPFQEIIKYVSNDKIFSHLSDVQKAQWLEFNTLLAGYLLSSQGERMGLAHGVENRCPFLDFNVQKLASSINLQFDDGFTEKYMLRNAFSDLMPSQITKKAKHPYRSPDSSAFVNHCPGYIKQLCYDDTIGQIDIIDKKFSQALIKKIIKRTQDKSQSVTVRDNQAFIYLMSIIELNQWFVKREGITYMHPDRIDAMLVKAVDARS